MLSPQRFCTTKTQSGHRPEGHPPSGGYWRSDLRSAVSVLMNLPALDADDGFATETAMAKLFEHLGHVV
jgi:hypothetical protein